MISAKIFKDSINEQGNRITTFELEYPRFIHSEFLTHRLFSRNAASSRAIPVVKMLENIGSNPAMPVHWGKNQAGMQAKEELTGIQKEAAIALWKEAARSACVYAKVMNDMGVHKQITNRITEPFVHMKTVLTATEFSNWYTLRYHEDAQPEIFELAKIMRYAQDTSRPEHLKPGEWHIPYVTRKGSIYHDGNGTPLTLEEALAVSASCCAQVSYRKNDDTLEKARMIFDRLINSRPCHASPVEHQARAMDCYNEANHTHEVGITHVKLNGQPWSNNFKGWIQYRALLNI